MEKGIQIALRYLENKLTRLINCGVLIKLTQSQNNYSNLHFYCSTLVFNIYFLEFAKLLAPAPPHATALVVIRSLKTSQREEGGNKPLWFGDIVRKVSQ